MSEHTGMSEQAGVSADLESLECLNRLEYLKSEKVMGGGAQPAICRAQPAIWWCIWKIESALVPFSFKF